MTIIIPHPSRTFRASRLARATRLTRAANPRAHARARAPPSPLWRIARMRDRRAWRRPDRANARDVNAPTRVRDRYSPRTLTPHWMFITVDIVIVSSCRVVTPMPTQRATSTTKRPRRATARGVDRDVASRGPKTRITRDLRVRDGRTTDAHMVLVCANYGL